MPTKILTCAFHYPLDLKGLEDYTEIVNNSIAGENL